MSTTANFFMENGSIGPLSIYFRTYSTDQIVHTHGDFLEMRAHAVVRNLQYYYEIRLIQVLKLKHSDSTRSLGHLWVVFFDRAYNTVQYWLSNCGFQERKVMCQKITGIIYEFCLGGCQLQKKALFNLLQIHIPNFFHWQNELQSNSILSSC